MISQAIQHRSLAMKSSTAVRAAAAKAITDPLRVLPIGMACFLVTAVTVLALS
jgi:hypothetical protein